MAKPQRRRCHTCHEEIRKGPGAHIYCSDECRPPCSVEGCHRISSGERKLCRHHVNQVRLYGEVRPIRWANEWVCVVCGADVEKGLGRRRHCSARCQMLSSLNPNRPKSFDCIKCGETVSLIVPSTKTGQFKRSDSKMCDMCRKQTKWSMTVGELARRDGTDCKICGEPVEMDAGPKDYFRPSVDHILPRACGGGDEPSNLQLAHLWCNQVKQARPDFEVVS